MRKSTLWIPRNHSSLIVNHFDTRQNSICTKMLLQARQGYSLQCTGPHTRQSTKLVDRGTPYTRATSAKNKNRIRERGSLFPCFPCNFSVSGYVIHWCTFQTSCLVHKPAHTSKIWGQLWLLIITHKFTRTAVSMSSSTCNKHAQITKPAPVLKFHSNSLCTKVVYACKLYLLRT